MAVEREPKRFRSAADVEGVVRGFESGELPPDDFNHREHLCVALWYELRHPHAEALAALRGRLLAYLARHGVDPNVYNETLTDFWMRRVRAFLDKAGAARPAHELADELCEECGDSRLVYRYFSKTLLDSGEARRRRVAPDLKPLDF